MNGVDPSQITQSMAVLLSKGPPQTELRIDGDGWADLPALCAALSKLMQAEVTPGDVQRAVRRTRRRFEIRGVVVRARAQEMHGRGCRTPDVLFHATTESQLALVRRLSALSHPSGAPLYLSAHEAEAWRAAHRSNRPGTPRVLYVDASRARHRGVRFFRHRRGGMFRSTPIPIRHILNLQRGFELQYAAGGIPIRPGRKGWEVALIRVARRRSVTWEVAKGKLEEGEPPEVAAVREVGEEMGTDVPMAIDRFVADIRYPFTTPDGSPRLKTVSLYLLRLGDPRADFSPKGDEGIRDVRWFPIDEALRHITHPSLRPAVRRAQRMLRSRALPG